MYFCHVIKRNSTYLNLFVSNNLIQNHYRNLLSIWNNNNETIKQQLFYHNQHQQTTTNNINELYYESVSDLPTEAKVIIYGDELVSKSLAYHLSNSLGSNVLVIRGNGTQNGKRINSFNPDLNSFYMNHMIVSNPRSSLLVRHSTELFNVTTCGSINLAQTEERVKSFKRMISISKLFIPKESGSIELLSPGGLSSNFIVFFIFNFNL